ncbi:hypothetical protein ACNF42_07270 [Cuniculiplasma sp. SKW3]
MTEFRTVKRNGKKRVIPIRKNGKAIERTLTRKEHPIISFLT